MIPPIEFKSQPLTSDKRKSLGRIDFALSFLTVQIGNFAFIQSKITQIPRVSEIFDNASMGIFLVSVVFLYFAFYNQIKSKGI